MSSKTLGRQTVVIGGGYAGLAAIRGLRQHDKTVSITLIEPKDYMEAIWSAYRSHFDATIAEKSMFMLAPFCESHQVKHLRSTVTGLDLTSQMVALADGTTVPYDVVLIATGGASQWPSLGKGLPSNDASASREARLAQVQAEGARLLTAKAVVVVGGGLIGTELAGDLAAYGKATKVTLVHSKAHLCPELSFKAAVMVRKKLEKLGVTVVLNERAKVNPNEGTVTRESNGELIEVGHPEVIYTVGFSPLNSFLDSRYLNDYGWINVDQFFRIPESGGRLFALGDCCTALPNSGAQVLAQIKTIGYNLAQTLTATPAVDGSIDVSDSLKKYSPGPEVYIASVGPKDGVAYVKGVFHTQFMLPTLKNKTFFLFKIKSDLGLK